MSALRIKTADSEKKACEPAPLVLTIGHSTLTLKEFISLLHAHGTTCVVDVRTVPRSRHNPQFNKASLPSSLKKAGLGYVHLPGLGGLRRARPDSVNLGWRNASFRGYADYMQTPEFEQSLDEMVQVANQERIVLMCAEAVPWRCHRSLIADALLVRGVRRRGHHEFDSPPYSFAYSVRQSPGHHDRLSGQHLADHCKSAR
jgi:uncharacterized protein (DUF488 family)